MPATVITVLFKLKLEQEYVNIRGAFYKSSLMFRLIATTFHLV